MVEELGVFIRDDGEWEDKVCPYMSEKQVYNILSGKYIGERNKDCHIGKLAYDDKDHIMIAHSHREVIKSIDMATAK